MSEKSFKIEYIGFLVLIVFFSIFVSEVHADDAYKHILTIESPNPKNNGWFGYQIDIEGE